MVIVPTTESSDGGLAAVGLITSLIVDNQIVDLDRATHRLQYHAVAVPSLDPVRASGSDQRTAGAAVAVRWKAIMTEVYLVVAIAEAVIAPC